MNITISITLDAEQSVALDGMLADYNAAAGQTVTREQYLQSILLGCINDRVARNYDAAVERLKIATKQLSYDTRLALIAQVEAAAKI